VATIPFESSSVKKISATEMPQRLVYTALFTARFGGFLAEEELQQAEEQQYSEDACGRLVSDHYRNTSNRSPTWMMYSCLEHPSISLQIRADHRTLYELALESNDIVFANQPLEEVGEETRIAIHEKDLPLETLFNVRPVGNYPDYKGNRHPWSEDDREDQLSFGLSTAIDYKTKTDAGVSSQQATQWLTMNVLQNSIASGSLRSWLQLLDSHARSHKTYEMKSVVSQISDQIQIWIPEIYGWWSSQHRSKLDLRV
tara:strand:+ start:1615 stop:2382 length:768 start_codon:yes stop_codon:yes gene_type:complete